MYAAAAAPDPSMSGEPVSTGKLESSVSSSSSSEAMASSSDAMASSSSGSLS